jgi:hypothetical protein
MLQFAIPVTLRTLGRLAAMVAVTVLGLVVMYLACGLVGAAVLLVLVLVLGKLLVKAARGS